MNNTLAKDLPVVEVPLELRGMSDEDIIKSSESHSKKYPNRARLSKKERQEKKLYVAQQQLRNAVDVVTKKLEEPKVTLAMPKVGDFGDKPSVGFKDLFSKKFDEPTALAKDTIRTADIVVRSSITAAPKPASGRVLSGKFTFGKKIGSAATVVNAADLEKERAAERAKKIQEQSAPKAVRAQKAPTPIQYDADGNPIKRKRGRPRKNPLPEVSENM